MITVGQTWVSRTGAAYQVKRRLRRGWEVSVAGRRMRFHDHKIKALITEAGLTLYDPTERLDQLAEQLERRGRKDLAAAIDQITAEFTSAMKPSKVDRQEQDDLEEEIDRIAEEMDTADDPAYIEELQEDLEDILHDYDDVADRVRQVNKITPPNPTREVDRIGDTNPITNI